jgi:glucokinase
MEKVVAGIDIGGTFTKLGIVDQEGKVYAETSISTDTHKEIGTYLEHLARAIRRLLTEQQGKLELAGIGIGAPNGNYYRGVIEYAPNLNWKGMIPFVEMFKAHFDIPIVLTNDANAAALGEMMYGGARNMTDFIVITLGTGLGSGIVVNGKVVYGHDGFAGEMGHVNVVENGRQCGCGKLGCLEAYVSATGIVRTVYELLAIHTDDSQLRKIPFEELTAIDISDAASQADPIAMKAFDVTGKTLGRTLADVVALFSPEAIFLFGGLSNAGNHIFKPVKAYMEKNLLSIYRDKVKILPSGLTETNAAVLGSAGLIWKEILG